MHIRGLRPRAALAVLLLDANRLVPLSALIDALWPRGAPPTARRVVHNAVSELRRALRSVPTDGREVELLTQPPGYLLQLDADRLDLHRFGRLADQGRRALADGDANEAARVLRAALALWRGPALVDLAAAGFASPRLAGLEDHRLAVLEDRIAADLGLGRHRELVVELEGLVRAHPLRERLHAQLMQALYRAGRQGDALTAYRAARRVLVEELGVEPGDELRRLQRAILDQEAPDAHPGADEAAPPPVEERKRVTLLLVGPVEVGETTDPEDGHRATERVVNIARATVERLDGTFEDVLGATALGLFGVPRSQEDHAERAVRAAMAIREQLGDGTYPVRLAVATGLALVAARDGGRFTVAGGPLAEAARLIMAARPGEIVVSSGVRRATEDAIVYRGAVEGWGVTAARTPAGRALDTSVPLIDRDRELALLLSLLRQATQQRRPHLVTLVGPAGIGKSRLVRELGQAEHGALWRSGRAWPYAEDRTSYLLAAIVRSHSGIAHDDPAAAADRKLGAAVADVLPDPAEAAWVLDQLRRLLGLGAGGGARSAGREETLAAWRRLVEGVAARRPLLLVIEDLHWADDELLDVVEGLTAGVGDVPLLVVATTRPDVQERRPGWGGGATTLSLAPLSEEGTRALLAALLAGRLEGEAPGADLVARVGGSPLYAEEYVRMLLDRGRVGGVPPTVEALIAARLDRLPADDKRVLQDLAVLGQEAPVAAVATVGARSQDEAAAQLRRLEDREFVRRVPAGGATGEQVYAFRHILLRDVAYGQIPRARRADQHRRAAAWLETLPAERAELLAYHYREALRLADAGGGPDAGLRERALRSLRSTADRARVLGADRAAQRCWSAALELTDADDPARPELLLRWGQASLAADRTGREAVEEARDGFLGAGALGLAAEAEAQLANDAWKRGLGREARARSEQALAWARAAEPCESVVFTLVVAALLRLSAGEFDHVIALAEEAQPLAERLGLEELGARVRAARSTARTFMGDPGGLVEGERAVAYYLQHYPLRAVRLQMNNLANCRAVLGDVAGYVADLAAAQRLTARFRVTEQLHWLERERITGGWLTGAWDESLRLAEPWADPDRERGLPTIFALLARGRIRAARGLDGFEDDAARALAGARQLMDPQELAPVLSFNARVALLDGRKDDAGALVDELLELLGGRPLGQEIGADLPLAMAALGRPVEELDIRIVDTPWVRAARALVAGDAAGAAETYAAIGSLPCQALARLAAGQRDRALALAHHVGAIAWVREAEDLAV